MTILKAGCGEYFYKHGQELFRPEMTINGRPVSMVKDGKLTADAICQYFIIGETETDYWCSIVAPDADKPSHRVSKQLIIDIVI